MSDKPKPKPPATTESFIIGSSTPPVLRSSDLLLSVLRPTDLSSVLPDADWTLKLGNLAATPAWRSITFDAATAQATRELEATVTELRRKVEDGARALQSQSIHAKEKDQQLAELKAALDDLLEKQRLTVILDRVSERAQKALFAQPALQSAFMTGGEHKAFVMAVDIRRSTELMLKARRPDQFASFLTTLCRLLESIVKDCHGVFDKFTGDGILAFFPDFFSGTDAAYWCLSAADRAHAAFTSTYHAHRTSFNSVLNDVGLGIGIDFGPVHVVQVAGGVTVVGPPVVYACRLSGAPAGKTLLNQPAYEKVMERISGQCFIHETALEIKHEGPTLAYEVRLTGKPFAAEEPGWVT